MNVCGTSKVNVFSFVCDSVHRWGDLPYPMMHWNTQERLVRKASPQLEHHGIEEIPVTRGSCYKVSRPPPGPEDHVIGMPPPNRRNRDGGSWPVCLGMLMEACLVVQTF